MMLHMEWEIDVDKPVSQVFAAFADRERAPGWSGLVVEVRKLTEGPVAVGSRWVEVAQIGSNRRESTWEITGYEPDRVLRASAAAGVKGHWEPQFGGAGLANIAFIGGWGEQATLEARFAERDPGTKLRLRLESAPSGAARALYLVIRPFIRRRFQKELARFKASVEEGTG